MLKSLLNFLLVLLLFVSTLGYVGHQILQPDFLANQAEKVNLYEQATSQLIALLPKDAAQDSPLSASETEAVIKKALDANTFYRSLHLINNGYVNYLAGRTKEISYNIDLTETKNRLTDETAALFITKYRELPACQPTELKTWDATNSFPSCQLPATNVRSGDVERLLTEQASKVTANLPSNLKGPIPNEGLATARDRMATALRVITVIWLITLGVTLLYALVWRRRAFLPLAFIFIMVGILQVGFSLLAWDWLKRLIVDLLHSPDTSQGLVTIITTLTDDVLQTLKTLMGNISIITLSIGGLFLILWGFTRFSRPKSASAPLEIPRR